MHLVVVVRPSAKEASGEELTFAVEALLTSLEKPSS
jgi:RNase P protein component